MLKFVLVVLLFAGLVYAIAWTIERRRALGGNGGATTGRTGPGLPRRRRSSPPPKQVAPDDDEDFLRWLDRKRRKDSKDGREGPEPTAGE